MSVGALAAFQAIFLSSSYSLATLTQYFPTLVEAAGGMKRVEDLLARESRVADSGTAHLRDGVPEIRFDNVTFGYAQDEPSLRDLNLSIHQTGMVAIVGSSGSGKSTILNLLMRLYDPDGGSITVNGADLADVPLRDLRSRIGFVPQDSFLFDLSVRDNIRLGRPSATDAEVEEAAKGRRNPRLHPWVALRLRHGGGGARQPSLRGPAAAGCARARNCTRSQFADPGRINIRP
jgi:ATP-binding cassette subfamily B protein